MNSLTIGSQSFTWGERTYVMGILNLTPDSFSGDGLLSKPASPLSNGQAVAAALTQAEKFLTAPTCSILAANPPAPVPSRWTPGKRSAACFQLFRRSRLASPGL
jgi:hypothetical protein